MHQAVVLFLLVLYTLDYLPPGTTAIFQPQRKSKDVPAKLQKCCPPGSIIVENDSAERYVCQELASSENESSWTQELFLDPGTSSNQFRKMEFSGYSQPECTTSLDIQDYRDLVNGEFIISGSRSHPPESTFPVWLSLNFPSFCVDKLEENGSRIEIALVCPDAIAHEFDNIKALLKGFIHEAIANCSKTTGCISIVSAIFTAAAITIYLMLWREQNTHGWTQLSFLIALFWTYFVAGLRRLIGYEQLEHTDLSLTLELLEDFGAVSTSANLVALSFDLLFTLWRSVPTHSKREGLRRFVVTTGIAWSCGLAVMVVGAVLKSGQSKELVLTNVDSISHHLRQLLEFFLCIQNDMLFSFCLPVVQLALFFLNLVLFLTSVFVLYQKQKETKTAFENIRKSRILRFWIRRISKLFLLMGLWWPISIICVFDCIAMTKYTIKIWQEVLATFYLKPSHVDYEIPWHVYLTSNLLAVQAIIITLIFVWNRKTVVAFKKQYPNIYILAAGSS